MGSQRQLRRAGHKVSLLWENAKPGGYTMPSKTRYVKLETGQVINPDKKRQKRKITIG